MRRRLPAATALLLLSAVAIQPAHAAIGATPSTAKTPAQAAGERAAQASLPQSRAPVWTVLRRTRIGSDPVSGVFTAAFPQEVRAMDKKPVALSGFMLPLDADARSRHFLLSKYTPVCFFCPPGEPNEVVEVFSRSGLPITDHMVQVSGRFGLVNNGERGLFFRIDDAQVR